MPATAQLSYRGLEPLARMSAGPMSRPRGLDRQKIAAVIQRVFPSDEEAQWMHGTITFLSPQALYTLFGGVASDDVVRAALGPSVGSCENRAGLLGFGL